MSRSLKRTLFKRAEYQIVISEEDEPFTIYVEIRAKDGSTCTVPAILDTGCPVDLVSLSFAREHLRGKGEGEKMRVKDIRVKELKVKEMRIRNAWRYMESGLPGLNSQSLASGSSQSQPHAVKVKRSLLQFSVQVSKETLECPHLSSAWPRSKPIIST